MQWSHKYITDRSDWQEKPCRQTGHDIVCMIFIIIHQASSSSIESHDLFNIQSYLLPEISWYTAEAQCRSRWTCCAYSEVVEISVGICHASFFMVSASSAAAVIDATTDSQLDGGRRIVTVASVAASYGCRGMTQTACLWCWMLGGDVSDVWDLDN